MKIAMLLPLFFTTAALAGGNDVAVTQNCISEATKSALKSALDDIPSNDLHSVGVDEELPPYVLGNRIIIKIDSLQTNCSDRSKLLKASTWYTIAITDSLRCILEKPEKQN